MSKARAIVVALLCSSSQAVRAETVVVSDSRSQALGRAVEAELSHVGIETRRESERGSSRRARRRSFSRDSVDALLICTGRPLRIEAYYPDGSRLGALAFTITVREDSATAAVEASERVRSERFVADVPVPIPYAPPTWWLGLGGDVVFSPGGIAPLALISLDAGYRFHRHWSASVLVLLQPYIRRLRDGDLETRLRLDQFGAALSYHPLVLQRVDLALGVRATAVRVGVRGNSTDTAVTGRRDAAWVAFPAARLTIRVALARVLWLRLQGEVGALLPRVSVSTAEASFGSLGEFAAQTGLGLEVHFR